MFFLIYVCLKFSKIKKYIINLNVHVYTRATYIHYLEFIHSFIQGNEYRYMCKYLSMEGKQNYKILHANA